MSVVSRVSLPGFATIITLVTVGCAPVPVPVPPTQDDLTLVLSELILLPDVTCEELRSAYQVEFLPLAETPAEVGLDYEETWLALDDDTLIRAWYLPARLDRGLVVLSQGAAGAMPCYLFHARMLLDNGWSVVLYEYRGFGQSSGQPDLGKAEDDLTAVLDWALLHTDRQQATLMGVSLGSIPSVAVAVDRPDQVNAVILDSPVVLEALIQRLEFALLNATQEFIDRLAPSLLSEELAAELRQPLLILQGAWDRLTPLATAERLFNHAAGPKDIVVFPMLGHARGPFDDASLYEFSVEGFLSEVWGQERPMDAETGAGGS